MAQQRESDACPSLCSNFKPHTEIDDILTSLKGAGYELEEKDGGAEVELSRQVDGETVVIGFNCEDMTEHDEQEFSSTFTVEISKTGKDSLVYHCNALMENVEVERVAFGATDSDDVFSGPAFEELPEDLRDAFSMHLYDRHIDGNIDHFSAPAAAAELCAVLLQGTLALSCSCTQK